MKQIARLLFFVVLGLIFFAKSASAANRYWVGGSDGANTNNTANWSASSGNACGLGGGASVPGSSDVAIFNPDCTNGATINSALNVAGMDINTGYTGTIAQASGITITVGSSDWIQDAGDFNGGDAYIDVNDDFTLNSGADFTSTSNELKVSGNLTINSAAIFTHNSGIITFDGSFSKAMACGGKTFNAINFSKGIYTMTVGSDCTLPVAGTDPTSSGIVNNGSIIVTGDWTINGNYTSNTGCSLTMSGNTLDVQALVLNAGTFPTGITTLYLSGNLDNSGNLLPNNIDLTLDGLSNTILTSCGTATFNSVNIDKGSLGYTVTVASNCTLPIAGTDPSNTGKVVNNGEIIIDGNWNIDGYTANSGSVLTMTGDILDIDGDLTLNAGTFPQGITTLFVGANLDNTGNLLPNNLDLSFDSSNHTAVTCGNATFNSVNISKGSTVYTVTVGSDCTLPLAGSNPISVGRVINNGQIDVTGTWSITAFTSNANSTLTMTGNTLATVADSLVLTAGTFPQGITTLSVAGSLDNSGSLLPDGIDLTLSFGHGNLNCGNAAFNSITVNKSIIYTTTPVSSCSTGNFNLISGSFANPALAYTYNLTGNYSQTNNITTAGGNLTFNFTGTGAQALSMIAGTFASVFNVNKSNSTLSLSTAFSTSAQACTVQEGTFDINGNAFTCGSAFTIEDGGIFQFEGDESTTTPTLNSGSKVVYKGNGDSSPDSYSLLEWDYHHLTINMTDSDDIVTGNGIDEINVIGNLALDGGIFTGPILLNVTGDWNDGSGSFSHNSGTVVLNGSSQAITGTTTFNNFTKAASAADTLIFPASSRQTFMGTMTLTGQEDNLLSLRSSTPETQWEIDPQSARTIQYLDVQDSNNVSATPITTSGLNITDSDRNTGWTFNSAPEATAPSSVFQSTDGSGHITFSTAISDSDSNDTKLRIEYSDDGGSNWHDPDLVSATPSSGTVDLDDDNAYQVGSVDNIDTSGGNITLTIVWDTQSANNENGSLDDTSQDDIQIKVIANDGIIDSSAATSNSFSVDNQDPSGGSLSINAGAVYATSTAATSIIAATGASQMIVSESSNFTDASWEDYNTSKAFTLSSGNGTKTVYAKFKDAVGNESGTVSDNIILDTIAPQDSNSINDGAAYTNSTSITLTISAFDATSGLNQMIISENADFTGASWEDYAMSKSLTISSTEGAKTVYLKFKDNAGNESEVFSDTITLDSTAPTGTININNGAAYTGSVSITLAISANDTLSDVAQVIVSEDSSFTGNSWESYTTSRSFTLSGAPGQKTVYLKAKDNAGNESGTYSDTIILDDAPPSSLYLDSPSPDGFTNSERPTFKWKAASPADSDLSEYQLEIDNGDNGSFSLDGIPTNRTTNYETSKYYVRYEGFSDENDDNNYLYLQTKSTDFWTSSQNDGKLREGRRAWKIKAIDQAGNVRENSAKLYVDFTSPGLSVFLNQTRVNDNQTLAALDTAPLLSLSLTDSRSGSNANDRIRSDPQKIIITLTKIGSLIDKVSQTITIADLSYDTSRCSSGIDPFSADDDCSAFFNYDLEDLDCDSNYQIKIEGNDWAGNKKIISFNLNQVSQLSLPQELKEEIEKEIEKIEEEKNISLSPKEKEEIKEKIIKDFPQVSALTQSPSKITKLTKNIFRALLTTLRKAGKIVNSAKPSINPPSIAIFQSIFKIGQGIKIAYQSFVATVFDSEPTKIIGVKIKNTEPNQAILTFSTNHPATIKVNYGKSTAYGQEKFIDQKGKEHLIILDSLEAETEYFFEIIAQGKNTAIDAYRTFETPTE
ncbi:MAG: hypothetical protein ABIB61_03900 [Candidatus Shapirobacteria bacterium]